MAKVDIKNITVKKKVALHSTGIRNWKVEKQLLSYWSTGNQINCFLTLYYIHVSSNSATQHPQSHALVKKPHGSDSTAH